LALETLATFRGASVAQAIADVLASESEVDIRQNALRALSVAANEVPADDPGLPQHVRPIATVLDKDADPSLRVTAANSLASLGAKATLGGPALFRAAMDRDEKVRNAAREALEQTGLLFEAMRVSGVPPRVVATLREMVQAYRTGMSTLVQVAELRDAGRSAVPAIITWLRYRPAPFDAELWAMLGAWGEDIVPDLCRLVREENDPAVRYGVAEAMAQMELGSIPNELASLLKDDDGLVRSTAIRAVGRQAGKESPPLVAARAVELLVGVLADPKSPSRDEAASTLVYDCRQLDFRIFEAVRGILQSASEPQVRARAAEVLDRLRRDLLPESREAVQIQETLAERIEREPDLETRLSVVRCFGAEPVGGKALAALRRAERDASPKVRRAASEALRKIEDYRREQERLFTSPPARRAASPARPPRGQGVQ
jgi:hypothetical protein